MPPRKRTESAPKPDPEETTGPVAEDEGPTGGAAAEPDGPREPQDSNDDGTGEPTAAPPDETAPDPVPERSDLQTVEQPCPECVPNGWPDGAFSVGCTHGTWVRDNA